MNETLWKYLAGAVAFVVYSVILAGGGYFSGYKSSDADHAENAVEVGQAMARLGNVIQKQSSKQAEITRDKQTAEQGRINAINTNQHQTKTISLLERKLSKAVREQSLRSHDDNGLQNPADDRYRVFDAGVIERLWNNASGNSVPTSGAARTVQTRSGPVTISAADNRWFTGKW